MEQVTAAKFSQGSKQSPAGEEAMQQLSGIRVPHRNDVLMGRGGKNNQHFGNETFRVLARERVEAYRMATKQGKSFLSRELVSLMRAMDPPARFLRKDPDAVTWHDVGDEVAREKASQVLRDSVAEKNGPIAQARKKIVSPTRETIARIRSRASSIPSTEVDAKYDRLPIRDPSVSSVLEATCSGAPIVPSNSAADSCDKEDAARFADPSTSFVPPLYPHVTPASDLVARKRPRLGTTPLTHASDSVDSVSSHGLVLHRTRNSRYREMRSPVCTSLSDSSHLFSSHPFYPGSLLHGYTPASESIPEHYTTRSGQGNQPWMTDVNSQPRSAGTTTSVRMQIHSHDFDPYNEDILSDQEEQRSVSPIAFPPCDSV